MPTALNMNVCKYTFDDIAVLFKDGTKSSIPKMSIASVMLEKDFETNFFPIFYIKCIISRALKQKILQQSDTVKFDVTMYKSTYRNDTQTISDLRVRKPFIKKIFSMVSDEIPVYNTNELQAEVSNLEEKPENQNDELELYLFIEEHLNRYRKMNNFVLKNVSISDVILYMSTNCGIDKLLMSKPNNNEIIEDFLMPPTTYLGAIDFIQKYYGIYSKGYNIFNDFDMVYLIDKNNKCTAFRVDEFSRVYINICEKGTEENINVGYKFDKPSLSYKINTPNTPSVADKVKEMKNYNFNKLMFVDTSKLQNITYNLNNGGEDKLHILDMKHNNPYNIESLLYKIQESGKIISIALPEIDLDMITINKEFYINMNLKDKSITELNKIYKLSRYVAIFNKGGNGMNEFFTCNCSCQFKVV